MKIFISYCQDNDGLKVAQIASLIYETDNRNKCWYFDRDKTVGVDLNDDIPDKITGWCDCVLLICTNGTFDSDGQKNEIKWSLDDRISIIPVRVDEAPIPEILPSTLTWDSVNSANIIADICRTIKNTRGYLSRHGTLPKREIPIIDDKGTIL